MTYDLNHMTDDPLTDFPNSGMRWIPTSAGDVLFRQADPTTGFYRVEAGSVTLERTTKIGDRLTLHRAAAGDLFAEASVFSDQYHCDAICSEGGKVQVFSKAVTLDLMVRNIDFASAFTKLLAKQVQSYRFLLEITAIKSSEERVLAAVSAGYLDGPVTQFATRIHLTQETCYRALRTLCIQKRLVQVGRGQYHLAKKYGGQ